MFKRLWAYRQVSTFGFEIFCESRGKIEIVCLITAGYSVVAGICREHNEYLLSTLKKELDKNG